VIKIVRRSYGDILFVNDTEVCEVHLNTVEILSLALGFVYEVVEEE
jgi:hypothetical protein